MRRILLGVLVSLAATWICLFIFDTSAHQSVSPKELMILASVQTPSLSKSTTHLNESTTIKNTTPAFDTSVDEFAAVRREENELVQLLPQVVAPIPRRARLHDQAVRV